MKIYSLRFRKLPSDEQIIQCPQCKAVWYSSEDHVFEACNCVRFRWISSEIGNSDIEYLGSLNREDFEKAYRDQYGLLYQDDEIPEDDLESPDPCTLERMSIPGIDQVFFIPEIPDLHSLDASAFCVGISYMRPKDGISRRNGFKRKHSNIPIVHRTKAPEWAQAYIGRSFDVESVQEKGWIDQNSSSAHYGVPRGPRIWLYNLGLGAPSWQCAVGNVWLRHLVVRLAPDTSIRVIYTSVFQVYNDGRGDFCTHDLNGHDIWEARRALEEAAPAISLVDTNP